MSPPSLTSAADPSKFVLDRNVHAGGCLVPRRGHAVACSCMAMQACVPSACMQCCLPVFTYVRVVAVQCMHQGAHLRLRTRGGFAWASNLGRSGKIREDIACWCVACCITWPLGSCHT
eukprot:353684-Chlamydomonas_euryale.AAC.6